MNEHEERVNEYMQVGYDRGATKVWMTSFYEAPRATTVLTGHCDSEQASYLVTDEDLANASDPEDLLASGCRVALRSAYRQAGIWGSDWRECPDCEGTGIGYHGERCEMCQGEGGWRD
jgi:hypothetical protein